MYLECLSCPKLGISCDGPNFFAMTGDEILEWCKQRKRRLGWSNAMLADMSGTPKGTIDRLLSGNNTDFKFETIRPIIKALVGGKFEGNPCPDPHDPQADETIKHLEEENAKLKETIAELKELKAEKKEEIEFLKSEVKTKRGYIRILAFFLAIAMTVILGALVIDYMYSHVGFFWVDTASWFSDQAANTEMLYQITE